MTSDRSHRGDADPLPPRRGSSSSAARPARTTHSAAVTRGELYAKKFVDLEYYKQDLAAGKYENLTDDDKLQRFGSPVLPIFVPLARGELMGEYEDRFIAWLQRERYPPLRELATHRDKEYERDLRIRFANLNASGEEKYEPKATKKRPRQESDASSAKRVSIDRESDSSDRQRSDEKKQEIDTRKKSERDGDEDGAARSTSENDNDRVVGESTTTSSRAESSRRSDREQSATGCKLQRPSADDAPLCDVVSAHVVCGCQQCLMTVVAKLSERVWALEKQIQDGCGCRVHKDVANIQVVSSQGSGQQLADQRQHESKTANAISKLVLSQPQLAELSERANAKVREDDGPIMQQLAALYDTINKRVALNEKTLEISSARLANTPVADIEELASLHDEKDELQELIHRDTEKRVDAIAKLAVYMWRRNPNELQSMANDPAASHVAHVQSLSHRKCGKIAVELGEKRECTEKVRRQLDESMASDVDESNRLLVMQRLGEILVKAEAEINELLTQRRREISTLINFDKRLRQAIGQLLAP